MSEIGSQYDVALSYASEQRPYVREVAKRLRSGNAHVFYDEFEQVHLWGRNLFEHLDAVYRRRSRYCVVFVSREYVEKVWTRHEMKSAQARALLEDEYILPARFDDTELPGLNPITGYLALSEVSASDFADLLLKKLKLAAPRSVSGIQEADEQDAADESAQPTADAIDQQATLDAKAWKFVLKLEGVEPHSPEARKASSEVLHMGASEARSVTSWVWDDSYWRVTSDVTEHIHSLIFLLQPSSQPQLAERVLPSNSFEQLGKSLLNDADSCMKLGIRLKLASKRAWENIAILKQYVFVADSLHNALGSKAKSLDIDERLRIALLGIVDRRHRELEALTFRRHDSYLTLIALEDAATAVARTLINVAQQTHVLSRLTLRDSSKAVLATETLLADSQAVQVEISSLNAIRDEGEAASVNKGDP